MITCPVPLVTGSEWVEDSRKSRKGMSKLGALWESLAIIRKARAAGEGAGRRGPEGRTVALDALSAATMDLGSSYFAAGDRLSTRRSFTSPLETHFIDFSIFLLWLLSHPTTLSHSPLTSLVRAPGDCLPTPPPPQADETGVKDLEVIPLALSVPLM